MSGSTTPTSSTTTAGKRSNNRFCTCTKLRLVGSKLYAFFRYTIYIVIIFFDNESNSNEAALNLVLFLFYPALLWLLVEEKYRIPIGLCGATKYEKKQVAIAACKSLYLYFALLLRIYKLGVILLFHQKAFHKQQQRQSITTTTTTNSTSTNPEKTTTTITNESSSSSSSSSTSTATKQQQQQTNSNKKPAASASAAAASTVVQPLQLLPCIRMHLKTLFKCRAWIHLTHELGQIGMVVFLLLVCLPVLAFWTMFISILYSCFSLIQFLRTLWKESQSFDAYNYDEDNNDDDDEDEFLSQDEEEGTALLPTTMAGEEDENNNIINDNKDEEKGKDLVLRKKNDNEH